MILSRYRMGRQIFEGSLASSCTLCDNSMRSSGPVCGNDGKTYTSICEINTLSCKLIRKVHGGVMVPLNIESIKSKIESETLDCTL